MEMDPRPLALEAVQAAPPRFYDHPKLALPQPHGLPWPLRWRVLLGVPSALEIWETNYIHAAKGCSPVPVVFWELDRGLQGREEAVWSGCGGQGGMAVCRQRRLGLPSPCRTTLSAKRRTFTKPCRVQSYVCRAAGVRRGKMNRPQHFLRAVDILLERETPACGCQGGRDRGS